MKITKFLHSCLLVEEGEKTFLCDPGQYTYEANVFPLETLTKLDALLITHEHADHVFLPFVKKIYQKFPDVSIITTAQVTKLLAEEQIPASTEGMTAITVESVPHEEIVFLPTPENVKFIIAERLTHPGDSFHFSSQTEILAMPMTAPWGSMVGALKKVIELKPKTVLPIHDWHLKEEATAAFYPRVTEFLKQYDITFIVPQTGKAVSL